MHRSQSLSTTIKNRQSANNIYDILATTCTRKWWETQSSKFNADDILSWGSSVHNDMIIQLPQYDTKI